MRIKLIYLSSLLWMSPAWSQSICVFDPMGASGDIYALMKDFSIFSRSMDTPVEFIPFKQEDKAIQAFAAQQCDGVVITDVSARQFNSFAGSMNAIGAITNNHMARAVLNLMDHPKLIADLKGQDYEVAGFLPIGIVRLVTRDRKIDDMHNIRGRPFAVMSGDLAQFNMVKKIGGTPISASVDDFVHLLITGKVDIIGLPALVLEPLEILKFIEYHQGGIANYATTFLSMNFVIRHQKFRQNFGVESRVWFKKQYDPMFKKIEMAERKIKPEHWIHIAGREAEGYDRIVREMRVRMMNEGIYNKKTLALLKKIRCQQDAIRQECALKDE